MSFEHILTSTNKSTFTITLNRPKVYNALTKEAKLEIVQAIRQANRDDNVRTIILTAEGKAFCSGQDLNDRTVKANEGPVDLGVTLETEWNPLVNSIRNSEKPVIAAINGVCAGAGVSVALACDLIVATSKAKFVSGFTSLGLIPDAGSSHRFAHALGPQKAFEFFVFNEPLLSDQALSKGLINAVHDQPQELAREWAKKLNNLAPLSLSQLKKNLQNALDVTYNESLEREVACQRMLGNTNDYQEGLNAFLEKRKPNFNGQ